MSSIYRLFYRPGDPEPSGVIPEASPWFWRWGWPGVKTVYRLRRLEAALDEDEEQKLSHVTEADNKFRAAKFSCIYGREGGAILRKFISNAEEKGLASHSELRNIVQSGELRIDTTGSKYNLERSWLLTAFSIAFLLLNVSALTGLGISIIFAAGGAFGKMLALFVVAIFYGYNLWEFSNITIISFARAKRLVKRLQEVMLQKGAQIYTLH